MSISGISSTNVYQSSLQTWLQQLKSDFTDLEKSLNSGDLAVAQKAFATLMQDMESGSAQNTTVTSTSDSTAANPQSIGSIINLTT
ncbi:MAG: hypothetical protein NTU69_12295 [Proteobacteria bacterium]|nr:hypothetical protein [Pseudomonadota bacterium]